MAVERPSPCWSWASASESREVSKIWPPRERSVRTDVRGGRAMRRKQDGTDFGSILRRYRAAAGLTQAELAARAGMSRRGIADIERGARSWLFLELVACLEKTKKHKDTTQKMV